MTMIPDLGPALGEIVLAIGAMVLLLAGADRRVWRSETPFQYPHGPCGRASDRSARHRTSIDLHPSFRRKNRPAIPGGAGAPPASRYSRPRRWLDSRARVWFRSCLAGLVPHPLPFIIDWLVHHAPVLSLIMNLSDAIEINARRRSDHPAIVRRDGSVISYREYGLSVQRWAAVLATDGIGSGDIVGVNLKDTADHLVALYAIARSGAAILPMDWRWTVDEKDRIARFFGAQAVLTEPDDPFLEANGSWACISVDAAWQQRVRAIDLHTVFPAAEDSALVLALSSGTTGTPKGPMITHQQFLARFLIYFVSIGFSERDKYLCATPLYFGGCRGYSMCTLYAGGTVLMHPPPYEPSELLAYANAQGATRLFLVPTLLRRLLSLTGGSPEAPLFRSLALLFSTGAVLHTEERDELMRRFCPRYLNFYGSTDGGGCSALMWDDPPEVAGSVGRPVFGATLNVVDHKDTPLSAGEVGRIRYRHPGTASGYYNDAMASREAFRDGWYYPGDLGWIDEGGYLFLAGRETDMIIRSGANIYPAEIEHILTLHPGVLEAAVLGRPSHEFGEEIAAFVILRAAPAPVTGDELIEHCRGQLASYKVPRDVFIVDSLPKSGVGKVLKKELAKHLDPI